MTATVIRRESPELKSRHAFVAAADGQSGCAVCGRKPEAHEQGSAR